MRRKKTFKPIATVGIVLIMCGGLAACSVGEIPKAPYQVTEENQNPELIMDNQPESPYWFPEQLLKWTPKGDTDLNYNVSTIPLAKRVDKDKLNPVNQTQNKDTKVMAISIMNSSTSGNAPHGLNKADCNAFTYWQYVDTLVYWGGASGEGLIVPPSPDVTDEGHKNGVPVIGTVFFPQDEAGGNIEWLNTFLAKEDSGTFPMADKLVEAARTYGFDGWFINQETKGTQDSPLTPESARLMQELIKYMKQKAPELEIIYYDSMTSEGKIDWQNALTDKNLMFMKDDQGDKVADDMFLNFWWTEDKLAEKGLLKASAEKAAENGIDPYSLYAGVDVQANGYITPIRWDLFESGPDSTYTSLGLYCPSWAYYQSTDSDDFQQKETAFWVNSKQAPSAEISYSSPEQWRGISTYVIEKSAVTSLPFATNFCTGNGYSFFKEGTQISKLDWNNRSIADLLPTYRFLIEHEGTNKLKGSFDVGNAWYGGNSLRLKGTMDKGKSSTVTLYSADLPLEKGVIWTTTAKASADTELDLVLTFDDGSKETVMADQTAGLNWTTITYDVSGYEGRNVSRIAYRLILDQDSSDYSLNLGNISVYEKGSLTEGKVTDAVLENSVFDEDNMYAGIRLSWKSEGNSSYYEVYQINEDKSRSLLGVSNNDCFYVNTLPRPAKGNTTDFEIAPVSLLHQQGKSIFVKMEWPDNSIPKAGFKASETLVAPGTTVSFESTSSENTQEVNWVLSGSSNEKASGNSVSVTYDKEGIYDVYMTASNESGKDEKSVEGCIVVTSEADGDLKLLSQGKPAKATSFTNDNEAPGFAVDGDKTKKWCATGTSPHELTVDLGMVDLVSQIAIAHAEAGGESPDMNTKAYSLSVSEDGVDYKDVVQVTRNTSGNTIDTFAPVKARYIKLSVIKPTQSSDTAARIYEVEVFGLPSR